MNRYVRVALLTSSSVLLLATAGAQELELEEVVVTGSRVITNGNDSPTPVTVVSTEELQTTNPRTIFESLLDMPAFAGSRGGTASNPSGNQANSNQVSALNLRGLGSVRTLVLYDGHRVMPTIQDGSVNANTIPQLLLQRVDIVTGGASAVYGSDAIGGVVNFVTDRKFQGVKVNAKSGVAEPGDARTYQFGVAFGTALFGGRGNLQGSFETYQDDGIVDRNDRDQFRGRWTIQGAGTAALPYFLVAGANNTTYTNGGKIVAATAPGQPTNPLLNNTFRTNGVLSTFQNGASGAAAGISGTVIQIGGDGTYDTRTSLKPESAVNQLYARFDFDITDDLHYYLTASGTLDHTYNVFGDVNVSQVWNISTANPYLDATYRQRMEAAGVTIFGLNKKFGVDSLVPPSNVDNYYRTLYANTGLEGTLGDYKWEVSYTRGDVTTDAKSNYTFNNGRLYAALDTVRDANGNIVCWVSTQPQLANLYPGCVPLNPFGPSSESAAAVDYVQQKAGTFRHKSVTHDVAGSIAGAPFDNWAGPVNMALSGEWRREKFQLTSDKPTVNFAPLDCTGLRFSNCIPVTATVLGTPQFNGGAAPRPPVSMTVSEAAYEADIPMLKDLPAAQAVDLNLAYRYAKYRAKGNTDIAAPSKSYGFKANTWKAGLDWHFNEQLTLRATRSRDIRAPNLNDLFQPNAITFTNGVRDLLTNSLTNAAGGLPQIVNGGNPTLQPEVASTTTVGVVFDITEQLSVAVDAFDISVQDYIFRIAGSDVLFQNACYDSGGASYYCSLQERALGFSRTPANQVQANAASRYYTVPANVAELSTKGLDLEVNYKTELFHRAFALRGMATYQPHVLFVQPGSPAQDYAGNISAPAGSAAGPKLRVNLYAHFGITEQLALDWQTRWRDKLRLTNDPTVVYLPSADATAVAYSNLTLSYKFDGPFAGQSNVYLNVQNVFNQQAPIGAAIGGTLSPGLAGGFIPGDDPIGRYYTLGVRFKM